MTSAQLMWSCPDHCFWNSEKGRAAPLPWELLSSERQENVWDRVVPCACLVEGTYSATYWVRVWSNLTLNFCLCEVWMRIQAILIIHGSCICKSAYSLKFIWNPQTHIYGTFMVLQGYEQKEKKIESTWHASSQLRFNKGTLCFVSASILSTSVLLGVSFGPHFSQVYAFYCCRCYFKWPPA